MKSKRLDYNSDPTLLVRLTVATYLKGEWSDRRNTMFITYGKNLQTDSMIMPRESRECNMNDQRIIPEVYF